MTFRPLVLVLALCGAGLVVGCDSVTRANVDRIDPFYSTRADVHALLGDPADRASSVVMPDREIYYAGNRVGNPHAIIYYVDDRVVEVQWVDGAARPIVD